MKDVGYYNGNFGPIDEMMIPMNDRVVYFGDGVYEVTYANNHKLFAMEDHLERFYNSLAKIKIDFKKSPEELQSIIQEMVDKVDYDGEVLVYWQVSRGTAARKHAFPENVEPNLLIYVKNVPLRNSDIPMKAITLEDTRFLHCDVKTLNLLPNVMASEEARTKGCEEAILHRGDSVTEGSHSNISIIKNGKYITPPLSNLILPSITRKHLLQICKENNIPVEERHFTISELFDADEILCNSASNMGSVIREIDGKPVGGKAPEIVETIQKAFKERFLRETAK